MMNIHDLLIRETEKVSLDQIFLEHDIRRMLTQLVREYSYSSELRKYGLPVSNKILLHGCSGCGKTMTAKAIAHAVTKPLYVLNLSNIVNSRIGETSQNIKSIFEKAGRENAVLFLDEFDQIGKARGNDDKDVGEMRRLVNTLIQLIDHFPDDALLVCATNHIEIIDIALIRRFQMRIGFTMPSDQALDDFYDDLLRRFPSEFQSIERRYDISYAEAKDYAFSVLKARLIESFEFQKTKA